MIGNIIVELEEKINGKKILVGFENHSGRTYLGQGCQSLGRVIQGYGNNGEDGLEGARYRNCFGTYFHGPLLPKNSDFADYLIALALQRKYGKANLAPLDDTLENRTRAYVINRIRQQHLFRGLVK